jgi:murein hydrolase activator
MTFPLRWPIAAALAGITVAVAAQQGDRTGLDTLAIQAGDRLQTLQREADGLVTQERTLLGDLRKLEVDRQMRNVELERVSAEAKRVAADLAATVERSDALERQTSASRPLLRARLVELYKLGGARYVRLLLSTGDIRRIGGAAQMVAELARLDQHRFEEYERTRRDLADVQSELKTRQRQLEASRRQVQRARDSADAAVQARNEMIRDIDRRRDLNAQLSGELQAAQQRLQSTLHELGSGATEATGSAALPVAPFRGALEWPVSGPVKRAFGRPDINPGLANGITLTVLEGGPVTAIHEGLVVFADSFAGFGNLVILEHDTRAFSLYGNLLDIAVKRGTRVEGGARIGSVGPSPTGSAELYFELRVDGRPVDPLLWLRRR